MKRLIQFFIALVMMIQGMQMAVAAVYVPVQAGRSSLVARAKVNSLRYIGAVILAAGYDVSPAQFTKAQIKVSATRPRHAKVLPVGTAGGLVSAKWTPVADASEAEKGLKAGTMIVSSESSKLSRKQRVHLASTPKLLGHLFPGSIKGGGPRGPTAA